MTGGLGRGSRRRTLIILARTGGAALLLGVVFGAGRWLADWSLDGDGAAGVVITLYFLLGGFLFSAIGWGGPPSGLRQERAAAL